MGQIRGPREFPETIRVPKPGSHWVWGLDKPHARALVQVVNVRWNGEEWLVETRSLLPVPVRRPAEIEEAFGERLDWNDLDWFLEMSRPVGFDSEDFWLEATAPADGAELVLRQE